MSRTRSDVEAFTACWHECLPRVTRHVRRRVSLDQVDDVVAEVAVVSWRRWDEVPDDPLPWILGVARKVIGNERRRLRRSQALAERIRLLDQAARRTTETFDTGVATRDEVLRALATLNEADREAILLVGWDELSGTEAALVLGVDPGTFRVRLHRARARLRAALEPMDSPPSTESAHANVGRRIPREESQ